MSRRVTITFKAPSDVVEKLDKLIASGVFSSRSEALRRALILLIQQYEGAKGDAGKTAGGEGAGSAEEAEGADVEA